MKEKERGKGGEEERVRGRKSLGKREKTGEEGRKGGTERGGEGKDGEKRGREGEERL